MLASSPSLSVAGRNGVSVMLNTSEAACGASIPDAEGEFLPFFRCGAPDNR